ncbi:hypothetical protein [Lacinutrix sp. Hel_I_90]|uniref:hypothetical protein n=1 Tax=Lacinutrix sp. Hel_I_90 TaxID=1249999 RepID=UPI0005C8C67A|nr:hypothetical protein [Lacinutrix sp. Hel_I_90]
MDLKKKYSFGIKDLTIVLLLLFGAYYFILKPERIETVVKETKTVDIKKEIKEAINNHLQLQKPEVQRTIIYQDRVLPITKETIVEPEDHDKIKNLNKYKDTTQLENGKIYSEILSDGTVYSNKIIAEMDVKTITKTKETKITKYGSGLFFSPSIQVNPVSGIQSFGASINYIYKGDFGIGAGAFLNTQAQSLNYSITLHKKIF